MFIDWSLYMACRCLSLPGTPDLWSRLGWLQGSTRNGMNWGVLAVLEISHSRGCCLKFTVLLVQEGVLTKTTKYQRPRALCPGGLYSWWHFASSANGSGSCDCAPVTWPMGFRVLQWCHPMLACAKRTSYCTRIITLYGAWKMDSGPRSLTLWETLPALP